MYKRGIGYFALFFLFQAGKHNIKIVCNWQVGLSEGSEEKEDNLAQMLKNLKFQHVCKTEIKIQVFA